jgi:formylglycine-generating enzyme required for sulfatase activity
MGSPAEEVGPEWDEPGADEMPRREVSLHGYCIGRDEVTVARYARFCEQTGRVLHDQPSLQGPDHPNPAVSAADGPEYPVVNVSWEEARDYCAWAGLRLPTEAEWERAARGGTQTRFWWGDAASHDRANYDSDGMTPVGSYPANPFGLRDTAGNVWEWCADWYAEDAYASGPAADPGGPASGDTKVHRGGSWMNYPYYLRPAIRYSSEPDRRSRLIGFRCARDD